MRDTRQEGVVRRLDEAPDQLELAGPEDLELGIDGPGVEAQWMYCPFLRGQM